MALASYILVYWTILFGRVEEGGIREFDGYSRYIAPCYALRDALLLTPISLTNSSDGPYNFENLTG